MVGSTFSTLEITMQFVNWMGVVAICSAVFSLTCLAIGQYKQEPYQTLRECAVAIDIGLLIPLGILLLCRS